MLRTWQQAKKAIYKLQELPLAKVQSGVNEVYKRVNSLHLELSLFDFPSFLSHRHPQNHPLAIDLALYFGSNDLAYAILATHAPVEKRAYVSEAQNTSKRLARHPHLLLDLKGHRGKVVCLATDCPETLPIHLPRDHVQSKRCFDCAMEKMKLHIRKKHNKKWNDGSSRVINRIKFVNMH